MLTAIIHLLAVILILVGPHLPFMKAMELERQQALEAAGAARAASTSARTSVRVRAAEGRHQGAEAAAARGSSDIDRQARTIVRAPKPTNTLPFSRGNSVRAHRGRAARREARRTAPPQPEPAQPQPDPSRSLTLPDAPNARPMPRRRRSRRRSGPAAGRDRRRDPQRPEVRASGIASRTRRGSDRSSAPSIQFDTKGVEFGPWLRRFVAQIRRNWFIPYAAMSMRGHVVVTFYVHRDGSITELQIMRPSPIDAFNRLGVQRDPSCRTRRCRCRPSIPTRRPSSP